MLKSIFRFRTKDLLHHKLTITITHLKTTRKMTSSILFVASKYELTTSFSSVNPDLLPILVEEHARMSKEVQIIE